MHYKVIHHLIEQTLSSLPVARKPGLPGHLAVALTFFAETGFYSDEEFVPKRHGMMNMSSEDVQELLQGYIRPRDSLCHLVKRFALVDAREDSLSDVLLACEYNVALQVLFTYFWFEFKHGSGPESLDDSIYVYQTFWDGLNQNKNKSYLQELIAEYTQEAHS